MHHLKLMSGQRRNRTLRCKPCFTWCIGDLARFDIPDIPPKSKNIPDFGPTNPLCRTYSLITLNAEFSCANETLVARDLKLDLTHAVGGYWPPTQAQPPSPVLGNKPLSD